MSQNFRRFGRYLILDHLVDGGMAKICRARYLGEQAAKIVAIKMVQEQFSKDEAFKQMFMDELKVAFGLIHPNIAQTYDYGTVDGQLYTAMEYVDGANLKQYLDRLKARNYVFAVEISVYIISQVCQGLHYAHTFTEKLSGDKFNIVHRDISPHNIMLTYDGAIKVIDFGIAKADTNSEATQAGTIKGKLSYLAPEYLEGEQLDHRYDQFAVGVTLWELLCSRKLFTAANDLAVLKQIQACKVAPPSSINPNVPKELDEIVLKALSKDRNNRYKDMDQLNRALVKFLYANYPDFNSTDLSYFAKELFKEEIQKDKLQLAEYGKIDIRPYLAELKKGESGAKAGQPKEEIVSRAKEELEFNFEANPPAGIALQSASEVSAALNKTGSSEKTNTSIKRQQVVKKAGGNTRITNTNIMKKEKKKPKNSGRVFGLVAAICAFAYLKPEMFYDLTGVDISRYLGNAPARNVSSIPGSSKNLEDVETGKILLSGLDPLAEIFLNGNAVSYSISGIDTPINKTVQLKVILEGYKPYIVNIALTAQKPVEQITIPPMQQEKIGLLTTSLNYGTGTIMRMNINGEKIEEKLPVQNMRIPAGNHEAVIFDPMLGTEKRIQFTIEENKKLFLE